MAGMQLLKNFEVFIINPAILVLFTAGLLLFIYGLVQFLWKMREGVDHKAGVQHMLWGIVGMFIMVSTYTIIQLVINTIGSDPREPDIGRLNQVKPVQGSLFNFK